MTLTLDQKKCNQYILYLRKFPRGVPDISCSWEWDGQTTWKHDASGCGCSCHWRGSTKKVHVYKLCDLIHRCATLHGLLHTNMKNQVTRAGQLSQVRDNTYMSMALFSFGPLTIYDSIHSQEICFSQKPSHTNKISFKDLSWWMKQFLVYIYTHTHIEHFWIQVSAVSQQQPDYLGVCLHYEAFLVGPFPEFSKTPPG